MQLPSIDKYMKLVIRNTGNNYLERLVYQSESSLKKKKEVVRSCVIISVKIYFNYVGISCFWFRVGCEYFFFLSSSFTASCLDYVPSEGQNVDAYINFRFYLTHVKSSFVYLSHFPPKALMFRPTSGDCLAISC